MQVVFRSDTGKRRKNNQDFAGYFKNKSNIVLAVLCDGMGGHRAGDVASEMAVSHLGNAWEDSDISETESITQWLLTHISHENERIVEKSEQFSDLKGMGTTLVAAAFMEDEFIIANIGDSRGYHYNGAKLQQITDDHSLVNELVKSGEISTEAAANHPRKNVLTRSLGVYEDIDIDITILPASPNDQLLLCSDGLTNMVTDDDIEKIISSTEPIEKKVETLVSLANDNGGLDNITVMLIYFGTERRDKNNGNG